MVDNKKLLKLLWTQKKVQILSGNVTLAKALFCSSRDSTGDQAVAVLAIFSRKTQVFHERNNFAVCFIDDHFSAVTGAWVFPHVSTLFWSFGYHCYNMFVGLITQEVWQKSLFPKNRVTNPYAICALDHVKGLHSMQCVFIYCIYMLYKDACIKCNSNVIFVSGIYSHHSIDRLFSIAFISLSDHGPLPFSSRAFRSDLRVGGRFCDGDKIHQNTCWCYRTSKYDSISSYIRDYHL